MSSTARHTTDEPAPSLEDMPLVHRPLPRWAPYASVGVAAVIAAGVLAVLGFGPVRFVLLTLVLFAVTLYAASRTVEGGRKATDRLVTIVVAAAFAVAMLPLVSLLWTVIDNGIARFDAELFTSDMRGVVGPGGGLMCAVYLVEYGRGRLAKAVTFLVDVMTGIPSVVAGLFAYVLFVLFFGPGVRLGIAGSLALSVLMIPVVIRSAEEMLKLVPNELREAAYALGVPKWRTVVKVVLPTAASPPVSRLPSPG
jgi:phosphate transport system permease protein